jgi:GNAT superfamily N-acetyltransferase
MTRFTILRDRGEIERLLRLDPRLHIYELGDLDEFFWPFTAWYTLPDRRPEIALLYSGASLPVLLALAPTPHERMRRLLASLEGILPPRFYAHLSGQLVEVFAATRVVEPHGTHLRMVLVDPRRLEATGTESAQRLSASDIGSLNILYAESYPGNWFDPRMVETGFYFGIRREGMIVSVAGVHVYSSRYRVAALGNITTHPSHRGRGFGTAATAALCRALLERVDLIGLNVKEDNRGAIRCYERLGFDSVATYGEYMISKR